MRDRLTLVTLVSSGLVLAPVWAQTQKPQQPVFRSDAHFVLVDAYPLHDGKVVEGLSAADFEIREEGVPQTIDTFEFVGGGAPEPESARRDPNTVAESRAAVADPRARAFVVDLDIAHVSVAGSHAIRAPLIEMLNRMITPNDLFGVISSEHDPASISFARKVTTTEQMLARYWSWGMRDSRLLDADSNGLETCFEFKDTTTGLKERMIQEGALNRKLSDVVLERHRELKMMEHLEDLIDYIGFLREGRTSIVLVTEGWRLPPPDPALLKAIEETQRDGPPSIAMGSGRLTMFDSLAEGHRAACILHGQRLAREDLAARHRRLIQRANARNVSFIPVNPAGLVTHDSPISQSRSRPLDLTDPSKSVAVDDWQRVTAREDGLRTLANNTDGTAVVGNSDLREGLGRVTAELRSFYLLGYYSSNRVFDGRPRRIAVKAKDYEVRARRGYIAPTEAERTARANRVKAAGPSAVELALDVLSGLRSADDRTFNVSRYLKADAAPLLGVPALFRATSSPRSPLVPVTAPAYTRSERIHIEWPVAQTLTERTARLLGRNSAPLAVAVTLTERDGPTGPLIVADAALGALAPGDYVVELRVTGAGGTRTSLVAFRVVP